MIIAHFNNHMNQASSCQGSRAVSLQAEKADALDFSDTRLTPSNLRFLRLDGCNPHGYWLCQPPNLANLFHSRTHARMRAYAHG